LRKNDDADKRQGSGLLRGSEPIQGIHDHRTSGKGDDDKSDQGDDDSKDSDKADSDLTDKGDLGDDSRDADNKD
jgi:hypothetical protein